MKAVMDLIAKVSNCAETDLPWVNCHITGLEQTLEHLISLDREEINNMKALSRFWMEQHWSPDVLIRKYTDIYRKVLAL